MSKRLLFIGAMPTLGLLVLFAALALATRSRSESVQVWLQGVPAATPPLFFLQRADGRFHRYRLADSP